jgi:DNA-directed RNA polymerase subunit RPC12/RpoP
MGTKGKLALTEELKSQWNVELNFPLIQEDIILTSFPLWWTGECGHSWQSSFQARKKGAGCHYCMGKKILIGFNDFASQNPKNLVDEWHPTLNNGLLPTQIFKRSSSFKVWWLCSKGHDYESTPLTRAVGHACPYCSGLKILAGFNDLATAKPLIAAEWHPTKNGELKPTQVGVGYKKRVWWLCERGHAYDAPVADRLTKELDCHFCSGRRLLTGFNDLATINPTLTKEWHPTKNGELTPSDVKATESSKVWWLSPACGHEWSGGVGARQIGQGCPICPGNQILVGDNDLATVNPTLAAEWHPTKNGILSPKDFTGKSGIEVWWLNPNCGHEWPAQISSRANGGGCSVCANKILLVGFNDLATTSPIKASMWHPTKNGVRLPTQFFAGTQREQFWWLCPKCSHEWKTTGATDKSGCPKCAVKSFVSRPEQELYDLLKSLVPGLIQSDRNTLGTNTELDMFSSERMIAVEFNGVYYHAELMGENGRTRHHDKFLAAKNAGVSLFQVWEDDWLLRKDVVVRTLLDRLGLLKEYSKLNPTFVKPAPAPRAFKKISMAEAKAFLSLNSLVEFHLASDYFALYFAGEIRGVACVDVNQNTQTISITDFASNYFDSICLPVILDELRKAFAGFRILMAVDNCMGEATLRLKRSVEVVELAVAPDYWAVSKNVRRPKASYPDAKRLVWDAGKSVYDIFV